MSDQFAGGFLASQSQTENRPSPYLTRHNTPSSAAQKGFKYSRSRSRIHNVFPWVARHFCLVRYWRQASKFVPRGLGHVRFRSASRGSGSGSNCYLLRDPEELRPDQ